MRYKTSAGDGKSRVLQRARKDRTPKLTERMVLERPLCPSVPPGQEELTDSVARRMAQFEASVQKVEYRAGKLLAQEVSEAAACVRAALQNDIDAAGLKAAHLVYMVDQAHKRPVIIRWLVAGLATAIGLLGAGFYGGMYL